MLNRQTFLKRKYFYLSASFLLVMILLGLLEPVMLNYNEANWEKNLGSKIASLKSDINEYFASTEKRLNGRAAELADNLSGLNDIPSISSAVAGSKWEDYSIVIADKHNRIVSFSNFNELPDSSGMILKHEEGMRFFTASLFNYFVISKSFSLKGNEYFLYLFQPVEKKYALNTSYFKPVSLKEELSKKFKTGIEILPASTEPDIRDGRQFKEDIYNSQNHKLLTLVIENPSLSIELNKKREIVSLLQILCLFAVIIVLLGKLKSFIERIEYRPMRNFVVMVILALLRVLFFFFEIPTRFINGELTDASNFSSTFGYGIVRSPLDLFLTIAVILCIAVLFYDSVKAVQNDFLKGKKTVKYIFLPLLAFLYFLFLRAFGASIRSVVYDSTLKYFKDPFIIPDLPLFVMHLNILLIGLSALLIAAAILLYFLKAAGEIKFKSGIYIFLILQAAGLLFDLIQSDPQGNHFTRIIYIAFTFIAAYMVLRDKFKSVFEYSVYLLLASFLSILLLIYYNKSLERNSLSLTAHEFIKGNEKLNEFVAIQTAVQFSKDENLIAQFDENNETFNQQAFKLWSKSVLPKEILSVHISILNKEMAELGHYDYNFDSHENIEWKLEKGKEYYIHESASPFSGDKVFQILAPVKKNELILGYVEVAMRPVNNYFNRRQCYNILSSVNQRLNSTVDFSQLKIFQTSGFDMFRTIGDISFDSTQIAGLWESIGNERDDRLIERDVDGNSHMIFIRKTGSGDKNELLGVALRTRDLSIDLFDFFKVFFIHSIIILIFTLLVFITKIKILWRTLFNFRARLLYSLIIISIVPLFLSAVYFKSLVESKNLEDINYKLNRRAIQLERYLNNYLVQSTISQNEILEKAHRDLGSEFSLFNSDGLVYSTLPGFYKSTLLPARLNSIANANLYAKNKKQILVNENIDDYTFSSFYYKASVGGRDLTINVNNAFNEVNLSLSNLEVDIFLFGSYSFAAVLIILLSSFLAGQISKPIRELTRATSALAEGDLDVRVNYKSTGEINSLIAGFNEMVEKLKRSQMELAEFERETAWKEMARQVAHEIKNPLTPMKLSIQQLVASYKDKSPKFDAIFEKVTTTIISQIETLSKIASEFSGFARMPKMKIEAIDLNRICREAVNLFDSDLKIKVSDPGSPVKVMADSDHMKRSFINLIRNSIQAGASKMEIRISSQSDKVEIRFADNGKGIEKENLERIFDENFTTKEKGMGLGLSMAKKYFELLNGSISVESTSEKGTSVLIVIPRTDIK